MSAGNFWRFLTYLWTFWLAALVQGRHALHMLDSSDAVHQSKCLPLCTNYGVCNEELGRCDCPKHRMGPDCSQEADEQTLKARYSLALFPNIEEFKSYPQSCVNACNKRGQCISGFCHCRPGSYGIDCSLSLGSDGQPVLLSGTNYTTRKKRPHIYIYDLPPSLTSWVSTRRLDRPTHNLFMQRLLSSGARTADGDAADWYYIPIRVRGLAEGSGFLVREAIQYIKTTWPWWNATSGARHILIHTGDLGVDDGPKDVRDLTENCTWLTHWGLYRDRSDCCGWHKAHRPGQDVVIPVYISTGHFRHFGFTKTPLHPGYTATINRSQTFFFAGRICGDRKEPSEGVWPNCLEGERYSANARQKVHYHHHNRTGYMVVSKASQYDLQLKSSKFCLAPLGGGHGQRQIIVALMGCIPVLIGDHVHQPFEPQLDWSQFSVSVAEADIPRLHEVLAACGGRARQAAGHAAAAQVCRAAHGVQQHHWRGAGG